MKPKAFNLLLVFALFFIAYWFFGNLYEQIVMIPNQLVDSYETMKAYQAYFKVSNPIFYFVPLTQLAVIVTWILHFRAIDENQKRLLKKASIFGLLSLLLTAIIVTQINLKLFSADLELIKDQLYTLSLWWLIGNAVRIYLVGSTLYYLLKVYVLRRAMVIHPNKKTE
jgi:hypothetical protein